METSLRYRSGDSKALRIHAKQKFPIDSFTFFQVHGELDTRYGGLNYCGAMLRRFYPDLSSSICFGVQFDRREKLRSTVRGKRAFPVTSDGRVSFNIKAQSDADKHFIARKTKAAAEFVWSIFNFQKDQDVRLKVGYDVIEKLPYMQIRENNWTLNADAKGRWNVRYDL